MGMWTDNKIVIDGPIKVGDGYGQMTLNLIKAFAEEGYDVACGTHWTDATDLVLVHPTVVQLAWKGIDRTYPYQVGIRCSQPDSFEAVPSQFKAGLSMFEFTRLPPWWIPGTYRAHVNVVPSQFCKQVWLDSGVTQPVEVMPLGVDTSIFTSVVRPQRDKFRFLISGTLSERKSPWLAWNAFQQAFPTEQDVELIIKTPGWFAFERDTQVRTNTDPWNKIVPMDSRIIQICATTQDSSMVELLHDVDCYVYPTRCEGFGLSPAEAMATGLPVICTNATGCTEFMHEDHSYPLAVERWEKVPDSVLHGQGFVERPGMTYGAIGEMPVPDFAELVRLMRYVYDNREEAAAKGQAGARFVANNLTWHHSVHRFKEIVDRWYI